MRSVRAEGFCGWPQQDANACKPVKTYEQGGVMAVRYGIRANHGGFLKCRICDDPSNMSEECFNKHVLNTCGSVTSCSAALFLMVVQEASVSEPSSCT